jgi:uncharacterized membrane protein
MHAAREALREDGSMVRAEKSGEIRRPVDQVFYVVGTKYVRNYQRWSPAVKEIQQISDGPFGVGTKLHQVREINGKPVQTTVEITEFVENQSLAYRSTGESVKSSGRLSFEPAGDGTRVTHVLDTELGGFGKLAAPIVSRAVNGEVQADLDRMKEMLEV